MYTAIYTLKSLKRIFKFNFR